MNEILDLAKRHKYVYSKHKKAWTAACAACASWARPKTPFTFPVFVAINWGARGDRRDADNIHAGAKFILDGMVQARVLSNDNRRRVAAIKHVLSDSTKTTVEIWAEDDVVKPL